MSYRSFIGLEIHIHLLTKSKVFCGCEPKFGDAPNTHVCPVCMGYPGAMPVANTQAMFMAYQVARALGCELAPKAVFERKHYFYPDMPKNYQISQFEHPVGLNGAIELDTVNGVKKVRIHDVHLEEDAGKMIHAGSRSFLDYNRAGTSLLEIVTEPDLETPEEAERFLQDFRRLVRYLGVCDGNMEEGSLRCDANVSVNLEGKGLGTKVELKNMNSFKFVRKAMAFEIGRQTELLMNGGTVVQETRLWNENRDVTESMRKKEESHDYRYFPEPDIPPFEPDEAFLKRIEESMIEQPRERAVRLRDSYGLTPDQVDGIVEERAFADWFETAVAAGVDGQIVAAWLLSDVRGLLNARNMNIIDCPLTPVAFANLLALFANGSVSSKSAKQALTACFEGQGDPVAIIDANGWRKVTDVVVIGQYVDAVFAKEQDAVAKAKAGQDKIIVFLVGKVLAESKGVADPAVARELVLKRLE